MVRRRPKETQKLRSAKEVRVTTLIELRDWMFDIGLMSCDAKSRRNKTASTIYAYLENTMKEWSRLNAIKTAG